MASKDLISIMTPFCKDNSNPLHLHKLWFTLIEQVCRLATLSCYELGFHVIVLFVQHLFLSEEDHHLLLYHHTQSLLEDVFPNEVHKAGIIIVCSL